MRLAAALERDAAGAFAALAGRLDSLAPAARPIASRILAAQDALTARIRQLAETESGSLRTRVHGDYHLGQVLVVDGDFVILDFEGEPARPLAERRAKQSPLKDVAGMLRSFSYAGYAALGAPAGWSADGEARGRAWADARSNAFLSRYRKAISGTGLAPADDDRFTALLGLFLLEKTIYELRYELASRPDWVAIPLAGLGQLLSEGGGWRSR
jgi:maltose alpha-D-glucosyltransferase/alpha-amylase